MDTQKGNLIECPQGHVYNSEKQQCPWCPSNGGGNTDVSLNSGERTIVIGGNSPKQQTSTADVSASHQEENNSLDRTIIKRPSSSNKETDQKNTENTETIQRRMLRGWIVTFDLAEYGIDYKINEGQNTIGKDAKNSITIQDNSVSSTHALILYKGGDFFLRDEMSSNGTFVNGKELEPGKPSKLADGDEIKLGDTLFLFRTAFKSK